MVRGVVSVGSIQPCATIKSQTLSPIGALLRSVKHQKKRRTRKRRGGIRFWLCLKLSNKVPSALSKNDEWIEMCLVVPNQTTDWGGKATIGRRCLFQDTRLSQKVTKAMVGWSLEVRKQQ